MGVHIVKISESDSIERRISKLNSNFQNLLSAAMKLDKTGILMDKNKRRTDATINAIAGEVDANSSMISGINDGIASAKSRISELERNSASSSSFSTSGWSSRKWSDGSIELWGSATCSCDPGSNSTATCDLPDDVESVVSWQATIGNSSEENVFLKKSTVSGNAFSAIVENDSSSVATVVVNVYIIGLYKPNGELS